MQIEVIDVKIHFPNISQNDFDYTFECLVDCKQPEAADFGFNHPYFTPGGQYGKQWWQLDSSLALSGYKWKDRKFAEMIGSLETTEAEKARLLADAGIKTVEFEKIEEDESL